MLLNIHENIIEKLKNFIKIKQIPNIIFHGTSGSGKRTIVHNFINNIYTTDNPESTLENIKNNVMYINCAHSKGIKFIREELKFFAKTQINYNGGNFFKSIILSNADKLTNDAQSALRRCIELFNHTTRFFIIVEDKYKLLKPILSRLCEIYVPEPLINKKKKNLYQYNLEKIFINSKEQHKRHNILKKILNDPTIKNPKYLCELSLKLYEKAYSALDLLYYIEQNDSECLEKYKFLLIIQKIKREFRNEKLLILFILNYIYFRNMDHLENISFM